MIAAVLLWCALSTVFAAIAPVLTTRLNPATGVRLVVGSAVAITGAGLFVLAAAASTWAAQRPDVAELGDWSTTKLHAADPIPTVVAVLSAVALTAALLSLAVRAWRRLAAIRAVRALVPARTAENLLTLDDQRADAFATPGPHGRIVVTTGLIAALAPDEQAALIAHERSHLRHCHAWWQFAMLASAAANPLLRRTRRAADHAIERWADEDAAFEVGDRRLVATTLARVALLKKHGAPKPEPVGTAATGGDVPARVQALLKPPRMSVPTAAVVLVLLNLGALATIAIMQRNADALFDYAQIR